MNNRRVSFLFPDIRNIKSVSGIKMSGLHPSIPEDRGVSSRFRLNRNRRQELTAQMELDAVAMKSITEMAMKREAKGNAISEAEMTVRLVKNNLNKNSFIVKISN